MPRWIKRPLPMPGPWMTITMLVVVSTGRSFPGGGSPASRAALREAHQGGVLSLAVMRLRPWKAPICARIGDQNPTPSVTGCC